MEDQFGGRTDDDLFSDDFEPVDGEAVVVEEVHAPAPEPAPPISSEPAVATQPEPAPQTSPSKAAEGLTSSRYADKVAPAPAPQPKPAAAPPQQQSSDVNKPPPNAPTAPKNAPPAPKEKTPRTAGQNDKGNNAARIGSGANPRQKLTETELAAKMEQMKLASAEKTRKFEKAEQDEKQHAQAYAQGMEEARKRREEAAERRRRGEENQKQLNNEREKNRERKLKAMGMKDGGWDEGKEAQEEEESRRSFKGANGGIRGNRRGGIASSRYNSGGDAEQPDVDRFLEDRPRGRGRGRGRGGRGGRGGADNAPPRAAEPKQSVPKTDDFPALPSDGQPRPDTETKPGPPPAPQLPLPPLGKWEDEMEAADEAKAQGA